MKLSQDNLPFVSEPLLDNFNQDQRFNNFTKKFKVLSKSFNETHFNRVQTLLEISKANNVTLEIVTNMYQNHKELVLELFQKRPDDASAQISIAISQ